MSSYLHLGRRLLTSGNGVRILEGLTNYEKQGIPDQTRTGAFQLENMKRLLWNLGDPQNDLRVIQVAGSKGKGSVASFLASMFSASAFKVGLCVSPHVVHVTERIGISTDGTEGVIRAISQSELHGLIVEHKSVIEEMAKEQMAPTYFEMLVALSLKYFVRNGVKYAIVETGLGGETDATNVFEDENVDTTVICPIEEEHVGQLGNDLRSIVASETALVKNHRPVVLAPQTCPTVREQILKICEDKKCTIHETGSVSVEHHSYKETESSMVELVDIRIDKQLVGRTGRLFFDRAQTNLIGRHQHDNIKTAISAALVAKKQGWMLTEKAIKRGIEDAFLPGRFQVLRASPHSEWFVVDGAHTRQSAVALSTSLRHVFPDEALVLILSMAKDKQHDVILEEMIKMKPDVVIFTSFQSGARSLPPGTLLAHWEMCESKIKRQQPFRCRKTLMANISTAVVKAKTELQGITKPDAKSPGVICITGSLYAVGEALNCVNDEAAL